MYKKLLGNQWEVVVYGKEDGNARSISHPAHQSFISATQIHGNGVLQASSLTSFKKHAIQADAVYSNEGVACGVFVADCLPVVLVNNNSCAVVHCSRKTLYSGLLHKVVDLFVQDGGVPTHAYLGPCIQRYEVGKEFDQYFPQPFLTPYEDKYLFDMGGYMSSVLHYYEMKNDMILLDGGCTWKDSDKYWGYRRGDHEARNFVGVRKV